MWNKNSFRFLSLILILLLGFVACSRQDVCEEKMLAAEGIYCSDLDAFQTEDNPFNARIMKAGDHWVFSFFLPVTLSDGSQVRHQFEQRVIWSPELKSYLFSHLSESDYELLKVDNVLTRYNPRLRRIVITRMSHDSSGIVALNSYSWSQL